MALLMVHNWNEASDALKIRVKKKNLFFFLVEFKHTLMNPRYLVNFSDKLFCLDPTAKERLHEKGCNTSYL